MPLWDFSAASFDAGNDFDLTTLSATISPQGVAFTPDGLRAFVAHGGSLIYELDLVVAFDLTTAVYNGVSFSTATQTGSGGVTDLAFSADGTKLYVLSSDNDRIYQYGLPAWDLSTASYAGKSFGVGSQDGDARGLVLGDNDTKFFVAGNNNNRLYAYAMGTPGDISTGSYTGVSLHLGGAAPFLTAPQAVFFKPDGLRMFVLDSDLSEAFQWELSSAWDISTAAYSEEVGIGGVTPGELFPNGFSFSSDGAFFFACGQTMKKIFRWTLGPRPGASKWRISRSGI